MTKTLLPVKHTGLPGKPAYSDSVRQKLLRALAQGHTRAAAAGVTGIHRDTLFDWIATDDSFRLLVEQAEDKAEARFAAVVVRDALVASNPATAFRWLERRRPMAWKERVQVDERSAAEALEEALDDGDVQLRLRTAFTELERRGAAAGERAAPDGGEPAPEPGEPAEVR